MGEAGRAWATAHRGYECLTRRAGSITPGGRREEAARRSSSRFRSCRGCGSGMNKLVAKAFFVVTCR